MTIIFFVTFKIMLDFNYLVSLYKYIKKMYIINTLNALIMGQLQ